MTSETAPKPSPTDPWDEEGFARHYDRWMRASPLSMAMYGRVADLVTADGAPLLLDCGCGSGILAQAVLERQPKARIVALDSSPSMLRLAKEHLGKRAYLIRHDLSQALPFCDGTFQGISAVNVLWALPDPLPFLAEASRCLRVGRCLAVVHPENRRSGLALVRGHLRAACAGLIPRRIRALADMVRALPSGLYLLRWNAALDSAFTSGEIPLLSQQQVTELARRAGLACVRTEEWLAGTSLLLLFRKEPKR